mgnify:FL=1
MLVRGRLVVILYLNEEVCPAALCALCGRRGEEEGAFGKGVLDRGREGELGEGRGVGGVRAG